MSYDNFGALDASITAKLDADTDFQGSLADLSEDEKSEAIKSKKSELLDQEIKDLAEKGTKNEDLAKNYKTRAEKAEKELKGKADGGATTEPTSLSQKDLIVLMKADVAEEDIDEIVEYATFKKISVSDALKAPIIKASLAEKAEVRKSANATHTGSANRGSGKVSDETLLANASKGIVPEPGTPEADQLFWARRKKK